MAMIEVKKREGESPTALLFRFTRRVKRSGVLKEANKRRFTRRVVGRRARRLSAIYRSTKRQEVARQKKLGLA
jgi:ribosomal protein S21